MKKNDTIFAIIWLVIGLPLMGLSIAGLVDEFWSGMGGALIGVGAMYLVQNIRYQKNPDYRENVNTERNDERNRFLHMKAWQMAGGWFVIIAAVATFVFKFAGKEDLMMLCGGAVGLMTFMYWIFFLYLKKKY